MNMIQQNAEYITIQNNVFILFKEIITKRLFNRFQIHISNEEFKRIEETSIEEARRAFVKAVYAAAKKTQAITNARSIEKVKKTKANAMANAKSIEKAKMTKANAKANAMANAMAMAMANAKAMANARR